jgi:hypothetical protein
VILIFFLSCFFFKNKNFFSGTTYDAVHKKNLHNEPKPILCVVFKSNKNKRNKMIYFILTTCLLEKDFEMRKKKYIEGIEKIKSIISSKSDLIPIELIIVENNISGDNPSSFLDELIMNFPVLYTNHNHIDSSCKNIGYKELKDVHKCIEYFNIKDDDMIVKMTGRYIIQEENQSPFIKHLFQTNFLEQYDAILLYGSYNLQKPRSRNDCVTGLIGMKTKYVKQIPYPDTKGKICVEWLWAKTTHLIPTNRVLSLSKLGIFISPGGKPNSYYLV